MFTGIIEQVGTVKKITKSGKTIVMQIHSDFKKLELGESIAVNGVCLTVKEISGSDFTADATPQTFKMTTLGSLTTGSPVNLERALQLSGRLGGHIVTGHVDSKAKIISFIKEENAVNLKLLCPAKIKNFLIPQGSIAVDGISLTIADIEHNSQGIVVRLSIIPHTWQETNLNSKKKGSYVNIESDIIGKYLFHFSNKNSASQELLDFIKYHN